MHQAVDIVISTVEVLILLLALRVAFGVFEAVSRWLNKRDL